jgi:hypothetical protein
MKELAEREAIVNEEKKQIDPVTIKVRKLTAQINEDELKKLGEQYGTVVRVRIPIDNENPNYPRPKDFGFITFSKESDCKRLVDEGYLKYEFYELPIEAAFLSANMVKRNEERREREKRYGDRYSDG